MPPAASREISPDAKADRHPAVRGRFSPRVPCVSIARRAAVRGRPCALAGRACGPLAKKAPLKGRSVRPLSAASGGRVVAISPAKCRANKAAAQNRRDKITRNAENASRRLQTSQRPRALRRLQAPRRSPVSRRPRPRERAPPDAAWQFRSGSRGKKRSIDRPARSGQADARSAGKARRRGHRAAAMAYCGIPFPLSCGILPP